MAILLKELAESLPAQHCICSGYYVIPKCLRINILGNKSKHLEDIDHLGN